VILPPLYKIATGGTHIWLPIPSDPRPVALERAGQDDIALWVQGKLELYADLPVTMEIADLDDSDAMEHVSIYHIRTSGTVDAWCVAQLHVLPRWFGPGYRDYYTCVDAARMSPRSASWWRNQCAAGRVPGAEKHAKTWLIPYSTVDYVRSHDRLPNQAR